MADLSLSSDGLLFYEFFSSYLISVGNNSLPLSLRPGKLHFFSQVIFRGIPGWVVGIVLMD